MSRRRQGEAFVAEQMESWLKSLERVNAEIQELWLDRHIWRGAQGHRGGEQVRGPSCGS